MYFCLRKQLKFGSLSHNSDDDNLLLLAVLLPGPAPPPPPDPLGTHGIHRVTRTEPPFCSAQNTLDEGPAQSGPGAGHRHHSGREELRTQPRPKHTNTAQMRQSGRVAALGGLVWRQKQDTCCPFASVVLAGRPAREHIQTSQREEGRG